MQIIKYGRILPRKLKCSCCGAGIAYTPKDIKRKIMKDAECSYITCPVCGRNNAAENWSGREWI